MTIKRNGEWGDPVTIWKKAVAYSPNSLRAHIELGNELSNSIHFDEAIKHYRKAIEIKHDDADAQYNLGLALFEKEKLNAAIDCYKKATQIKPDFAGAYNNLGLALYTQNKVDEAIVHYKKAIEAEPYFFMAHSNLGVALAESNNIDDAIIHFKKALQIDPDHTQIHNNLGAAMLRKGYIHESIIHFRHALLIDPSYADATFNLNRAMAVRTEAVNAADALADYIPNDIYSQTIEKGMATELSKKGKPTQHEIIQILFTQADLYSKAGIFDKAFSCYSKIIDRWPGLTEAYYSIACILARQDRHESAIRWLTRAVDKGFTNWEKIKTDTELDSIKNIPAYKKLVQGH